MKLTRTISLAMLLVIANQSFAQLPVTTGLELWLDATDAASVDVAGGYVETWMDKSGNENNAFAAASAPEYVTEGVSGLPSIRFYGNTGDGMVIDDALYLERPYTTFIVNQYWGEIKGRTLQSQDSNWLAGLWSGEVSHFAGGWVTQSRPAADFDEPYLVEAHGFEESSGAYINGGNWTTNTLPPGNPGRLAIAGAGLFPAEVSDADVSEVVVFNRNLETPELESMRSYFLEKYSIDRWEDHPDALDPTFVPEVDEMEIFNGSVTTFRTAADLDFSGDFVYGINVGGPAENDFGDALTIGDVELTAGTNDDELDLNDQGVYMTVANELPSWFSAAASGFGDGSDDDNNLGFALQSIRWNQPPGIEVGLDVEPGESYKLQLMMGEGCCDRGFDVLVEGELMVDNLIVHDLQDEGINDGTSAVAFTHEFVAGDDQVDITLGGIVFGTPDNNPILHVLTLEHLAGAGVAGDFDGDGVLTNSDIDALSAAVRNNSTDAKFDLNSDGAVDAADRSFWVVDLRSTYFGDSNLDGLFSTEDMVVVFQAGKYELDVDAGWTDGDWTGDGRFATDDLVAAFQDGGYEQGPRAAVNAVPEPSCAVLLAIGLIGLGSLRRRR